MRPFQRDGYSRPVRQFLSLVGLVTAACALSACAPSRGGNVPYDVAGFDAPDVEAAIVRGPQRLGPLDKVQITVFQVPDLSGEFQVDTAGNIAFPLIGSVPAQGKTTGELREQIAARLGTRYLNSPEVQVAITEATQQSITVDGSVRQPGVIPITGTTSLMRAVALARGTSENANPSRVVVFRTVNGERTAAAFDLQAIRRAEAEDPTIYGNDIVIVDGSRAREIYRDILSTIPIIGIFTRF